MAPDSIRFSTPGAVAWGRCRPRCLLGYEPIPDARDRVDVVWLFGVALDLLAQPVHVSVHGARLDLDLVAPDLPQQFPAADHLPGLRGEQRQEVEFRQGQSDFFAVTPDLPAVHVNDEAWELEARLGLLLRDGLLAPAQMGTNPGQEFPHLERLGDVVVGPHLEPDDDVDRVVFGS